MTEFGPVDLARFNRLTDGDIEFARDLATTFAASGNQQLLEIDKALKAADRGALARTAHKLKGASANIYALELTELAARLEAEAPAAEHTQLQQVSDALRQEFNRTIEFLAAALASETTHAAPLRLPG
jgi:HPt (histidine-containing phosphotransfer) domain-containing protein